MAGEASQPLSGPSVRRGGEHTTDTGASWVTRLRKLDQELSAASDALEAQLARDWHGSLTSDAGDTAARLAGAAHGESGRAAYVEYGRVLGKLRRDPAERIAILKDKLDIWRIRTIGEARADLTAEQIQIDSLIQHELVPAAAGLHAVRERRSELRRVPNVDLAHLAIRGLSALILIVVAAALVFAEFSLAKQVTSEALGLEFAVKKGDWWFMTPVNLFAVALCALTLPFKLAADRFYDECKSPRWQWFWLSVLLALSLGLVCIVGWLRGDQAYKLAQIQSINVDSWGTFDPPSAPGTAPLPVGSPAPNADPSRAGDETPRSSRLLLQCVYLVAGILFPLAGGAALSKARDPGADVAQGVMANVASVCLQLPQWWLSRRVKRSHTELSRATAHCMRLVARVGPHAVLAWCVERLIERVRAHDTTTADELELTSEVAPDATAEAVAPLRAALVRAGRAQLPLDTAVAVHPFIALAMNAVEAYERGLWLDRVVDNLCKKVAGDIRLGYETGLKTAPELLGGVSAEDLYLMETHMRVHNDFFGASHGAAEPDQSPNGGAS